MPLNIFKIMSSSSKQLQYMQQFLIQIANGNFDAKLSVSDETSEELVAMQVGINMLVEELKTSTISRVFLNSIYDGINDVIIVLNEHAQIQKANHLVEKILGYSESDLQDQSIDKIIPDQNNTSTKEYIEKVYKYKTTQEVGLNIVAKSGIHIPFSCSFSLLYNNEHSPSGVLLAAKNITALLQAKNQLQEKNDELNLFVYKASHDLKSPVSSMQGIISLINKSNDINEIKMYCRLMEECSQKLDSIISDLLILGRITYRELNHEKINLNDLLGEIINTIKLSIDDPDQIEFTVTIDPKAECIVTERELLNTILVNLIENAVKYKKQRLEKSYVHITVFPKETGVLFVIEDNGIGIEKQLQPNIFRMFYRATYVSKGTGLGLYIVKTGVSKLGGHVSFESDTSIGTSFKIYIPNIAEFVA